MTSAKQASALDGLPRQPWYSPLVHVRPLPLTSAHVPCGGREAAAAAAAAAVAEAEAEAAGSAFMTGVALSAAVMSKDASEPAAAGSGTASTPEAEEKNAHSPSTMPAGRARSVTSPSEWQPLRGAVSFTKEKLLRFLKLPSTLTFSALTVPDFGHRLNVRPPDLIGAPMSSGAVSAVVAVVFMPTGNRSCVSRSELRGPTPCW